MQIEIERKFLVRDDSWRADAERRVLIRQGYLNTDGKASVRVREIDGAGRLTVKAAAEGTTRAEFDYPIPVADARRLLDEFCVAGRVEKYRNNIKIQSYLFEIDEFLGESAGLVIAELELESESDDFPRPPWLGEEVTGERRYYNAALATRPYSRW